MNMNFVGKVGKGMVKYAGPAFSGLCEFLTVIESQKQKQTIAELVQKVAELEAKVK